MWEESIIDFRDCSENVSEEYSYLPEKSFQLVNDSHMQNRHPVNPEIVSLYEHLRQNSSYIEAPSFSNPNDFLD